MMRIPRGSEGPIAPSSSSFTLFGLPPLFSFISFSALWAPLLLTFIDTVPIQLALWRRTDQMLDRKTFPNGTEFDFIVVGAGLAGSVCANRLARAGHSVLLLEAGGEPFPFQMVPGFLMLMINRPETDWMFRSVPQRKGSLNSVGRESSWSVGKGLGGTGTINIMIFLRGHKKDFDKWAKLTNDSSWSFDGLMPHFKSIEEYTRKTGPVDTRYHGTSGDMLVDEPDYLGIADQFVDAAREFGYPKVDLNKPFVEGFDRIKYPTKNGRRIASYFAFLQPVREMENIQILKYANVHRVLIDDEGRAYGVEYEKHGQKYTAVAKKEVIISAGTVGTAKALLLSGLGPKEHLEAMGIPVKRDLPVGRNLQDHLGVYLHPFFINKKTIRLERDITPLTLAEWFASGTGVLTSSGVQATGCISSSIAKARGEGDHPDIHYFLFGFSASPTITKIVSSAFNLEEKEIDKYHEHTGKDPRDSFYIIVTGARPFSRGFVKLRSSNPSDPPIIDPRYLEDKNETDLKVLLEAVKRAVVLVENSTAIGTNLGGRFTTEKLPGCEQYPMRSDAYWICYIRRYTVTLHHPVGTARMGTADDPRAVVDNQLKVRGIKGLRVVDSSIQPVIIVTNSGASALMIGEKGASMIIDEWKNKEGNGKSPTFKGFEDESVILDNNNNNNRLRRKSS